MMPPRPLCKNLMDTFNSDYYRTMTQLVQGDPAPNFRLHDAHGNWVSLADFASSKVILYFYPAALTPACTVQAVDFSAALPELREAGYTVLGVSPDEQPRLQSFIAKHDLTVTLLSDPNLSTVKAYGAWGDRMLWGKNITGLIRSTFVIDVNSDGHGTILQANYAVRATGHVTRLRESLGI